MLGLQSYPPILAILGFLIPVLIAKYHIALQMLPLPPLKQGMGFVFNVYI